MEKSTMLLDNYLDLLVDEGIDKITDCPVCIDGIAEILEEIYHEIKMHYQGSSIQRFMKKQSLYGILYHWRKNKFPVPIWKVKKLLLLWKGICNKSLKEHNDLYDSIYQQATFFTAKKSQVKLKVIKSLDSDLAYLLGVIYADGALRNIWLTKKNAGRFRYEITITEEKEPNVQAIVNLLRELSGIKTNVKPVYGGRWYRILFNSIIFHRLLHNLFEMPMGYKKGKLRIPQIIKNAPFPIKKHFLIGFFDGDGWCSKFNTKKKFTPVVSVSQSSKGILIDLDNMLKERGFHFNFKEQRRDKYVWHELNTKDKKQIKKFQEEFGFRYQNKKERLRILVESFNRRKFKGAKF